MLLLHGKSTRTQVLDAHGPGCRHCGGGPMQLVRRHTVVHLFFYPLFSYGDALAAVCPRCGATAPASLPPGRVLPKLPFLHRLGWLVPLVILAAPCVLGAPLALLGLARQELAAQPSAQAAAPAADGEARLRALEARLEPGKAWGSGPEAATAAAALLEAAAQGAASAPAVAVQLDPGPPRRLVAVVLLSDLKRLQDPDRRALFGQLRAALRPHLRPEDDVSLGVKGPLLYGLLAQRGAGQDDWTLDVARVVAREPLERALDPR